MANKASKNLILENARIMFRNFSGKEGQYNAAGKRNFCVQLDPKTAKDCEKDGWNVRYLKPREEGDEPQAYLQVAVEFKNIPPKIVLVTGGGQTTLEEEDVNMLDWAEIANVDLIVRPYNWEVNGKSGVKAYCKSMYVTIVEDEFADKYRDIPSSDERPQVQAVSDDDVPF